MRPLLLPSLVLLCLLAAPSAALDCSNSLADLVNDGTAEFNQATVGAVPGETVCGVDYSGWDFHVYQLELTTAAYEAFQVATQDQNGSFRLIVLQNCDPMACLLDQAGGGAGPGTINAELCLQAGTYTVIVASDQVPNSVVYNVGAAPFVYEDFCGPVSGDDSSWSTVKARY